MMMVPSGMIMPWDVTDKTLPIISIATPITPNVKIFINTVNYVNYAKVYKNGNTRVVYYTGNI